MGDPDWIRWVRELQAVSQTGLHYSQNPFDRDRFTQIGALAAEMLAAHSTLTRAEALELTAKEFGYATPKVDVRGACFRDGKILMVREIADAGRWTLPGGWADVNDTPSDAVLREIREESGFEARALKLTAVYDRERHNTPPFPFHIYKLFFLCEIVGGAPTANIEVSEVDFFAEDSLPELSVSRTTERQIKRMFEHLRNPALPADFD